MEFRLANPADGEFVAKERNLMQSLMTAGNLRKAASNPARALSALADRIGLFDRQCEAFPSLFEAMYSIPDVDQP